MRGEGMKIHLPLLPLLPLLLIPLPPCFPTFFVVSIISQMLSFAANRGAIY